MADAAPQAPQAQALPQDVQDVVRYYNQRMLDRGNDDQGNPLDQEAAQFMQAYQAKTQPHYDGNTLIPAPFAPIDLSPPKPAQPSQAPTSLMDMAKNAVSGIVSGVQNVSPSDAAKFTGGVGMGVAEAVNPLAIPNSLETLARAPFETTPAGTPFYKKPFVALQQASQKDVIPPMDLDTIGAVTRAAIRKVGDVATGDSTPFSQLLSQEQQNQQAAFGNKPFQTGKLVGEAGMAITNLAALAKSIPEGIASTLTKLRGTQSIIDTGEAGEELAQGAEAAATLPPNTIANPPEGTLDPQAFKQAVTLQKQLIGDLGPELREALYERTDNIKNLLEQGPEAFSNMGTVDQIRNQLAATRQVIGESVGQLRNAITQNKDTIFDTSFAQDALNDIKRANTLSGGSSALSSQQQNWLDTFQTMLQNPTAAGNAGKNANTFSTRDASIVISKLDDFLTQHGFYDAMDKGQKTDQVLNQLFNVRQGMDSELANMYPAYKAVKTQFSDFMDLYSPFQNRVNGMNAESFISNLFGKNKTELRSNLENLLNQSNETVDAFQNATKSVKTGSAAANAQFSQAVDALRQKASTLKFQDGSDILNSIADKAVASKLSSLTDTEADRIARVVSENRLQSVNKYEAVGETLGATAGGTAGGGFGAAVGSFAGRNAGKALGTFMTRNLPQNYTPEKLFQLLAQSKQQPSNIRTAAKGVLAAFKLGPQAGLQLLNSLGVDTQLGNAVQKTIVGLQGTSGGVKAAKDFASIINPQPNFANSIPGGQ